VASGVSSDEQREAAASPEVRALQGCRDEPAFSCSTHIECGFKRALGNIWRQRTDPRAGRGRVAGQFLRAKGFDQNDREFVFDWRRGLAVVRLSRMIESLRHGARWKGGKEAVDPALGAGNF